LNFDDLFRLYYDSLFRFARQFINDDEDCHDIVSNAYEDVWRNFSHIEEKTVKAYLYTTVRNRTIDYLRRQQKRQQYISYATHMMEQTISSEHIAEREDNLRIIKQVLDEIGHPTSDILTACYIDGKKYVEVAEEMQISIASVKKHMVKALKKVREIKKRLKQ
jgi:RNA polymerase sigma-70 factor (ECF subfamily)